MRKNSKIVAGAAVVAALSSLAANSPAFAGTPIHPETRRLLAETGELERAEAALLSARERGANAPAERTPFSGGAAARTGPVKLLVILVDFSDESAAGGTVAATPADFDLLLGSTGQYPTGSMKDYYDETSYGLADLDVDVAGWYRMPETYAFYTACNYGFGTYPMNAQRLAEDAVAAADADVDFADYDNDGDGWVDALAIAHAGPGFEDTGDPCRVWSHAWGFGAQARDGVLLSGYSMEPEESGWGGIVHIGVFCHEFGHTLGLPDLYPCYNIGDFSVMGGGTWANGGLTPVHFDAWCKIRLGWVVPENVTSARTAAPLPRVEDSPSVYRLWTGGTVGAEYFLVENRQRVGFDAFLPGSGLAVYHVFDSNDQCGAPPKITIEQADGRDDIGSGGPVDAGDFWAARAGAAFAFETVPSSRRHDGADSKVRVANVSASGAAMTADFTVNADPPVSLSHADSARLGGTTHFLVTGPPGAKFAVFADKAEGTTCRFDYCLGLRGSRQFRTLADAFDAGDPPLDANGRRLVPLDLPSSQRFVFRTFFVDAVVDVNGGTAGGKVVTGPVAATILQ